MGTSRTAQVMIKDETTPGLIVTPDLSLPITEFSFAAEDAQTESEAILAGRRFLDDWQSNGGNVAITGSMAGEVTVRSFGTLLKHAVGPNSVQTTGPTSSYYTHVVTPGTSDGESLTLQAGVEDDAGTVQPITFGGTKIPELSIAWDEGSKVNWNASWMAQVMSYGATRSLTSCATTSGSTTVTVTSATDDMEGHLITHANLPTGTFIEEVISSTSVRVSQAATATASGLTIVVGKALATASYASGLKLLKAHNTRVLVAASEIETVGGSLTIATPMETRFRNGSRFSKEIKETGELCMVTGELQVEHSLSLYRRFLKGEKFDISIPMVKGSASVTFDVHARITPGAEPSISGRGRNMMTIPFKALGDGTDADAFTATVVSLESTI